MAALVCAMIFFGGNGSKIVGKNIKINDINDFYYTLDGSTNPPYFQRYRFYKDLIDFIISLTTNGSLPLQNTLCKNTFDCTLGGPFEYVYLTCSQLIRLSVKAS